MYPVHRERQCRTVSSRQLQRRVSAQSDLVQRLERQRVLDGHEGCVNTAVRGLRNRWDAHDLWVDKSTLCCIHYHLVGIRYSMLRPGCSNGVWLAGMTCMPKGLYSMLRHNHFLICSCTPAVHSHSTASESIHQYRDAEAGAIPRNDQDFMCAML